MNTVVTNAEDTVAEDTLGATRGVADDSTTFVAGEKLPHPAAFRARAAAGHTHKPNKTQHAGGEPVIQPTGGGGQQQLCRT